MQLHEFLKWTWLFPSWLYLGFVSWIICAGICAPAPQVAFTWLLYRNMPGPRAHEWTWVSAPCGSWAYNISHLKELLLNHSLFTLSDCGGKSHGGVLPTLTPPCIFTPVLFHHQGQIRSSYEELRMTWLLMAQIHLWLLGCWILKFCVSVSQWKGFLEALLSVENFSNQIWSQKAKHTHKR
jgi:hypothetical protein